MYNKSIWDLLKLNIIEKILLWIDVVIDRFDCTLYMYFVFVLDQTHLAKERARSDAEFYHASKQAEANKVFIKYHNCICCWFIFSHSMKFAK